MFRVSLPRQFTQNLLRGNASGEESFDFTGQNLFDGSVASLQATNNGKSQSE
jgi:hypothetical protein